MERPPTAPTLSPLTAGAALGIANVLWLLAEYAAGLHEPENIATFQWVTPFSLLIPVIGLVWFYRRLRRAGSLPAGFGGRCVRGLAATSTMAAMSVLGQWLYHAAIHPEFFDKAIAAARERGHEGAEDYFRLGSYLVQVGVMQLVVGTLVSVVTSALLRSSSSSAPRQ
jgi:hypothetical protein